VADNFFQTHSGISFDLLNPTADMINIEDIAHSLSMQCRWGGHCKWFYSIAEHSVYVSFLTPTRLALHGLLHDAAEAYVSDVTTPLKNHLPGYKEIEHKILFTIFEKYGIENTPEDKQAVKFIDLSLAATEADQITADSEFQRNWLKTMPQPLKIAINCFGPDEARELFMMRFQSTRKVVYV
jgi:uncharacterized protein